MAASPDYVQAAAGGVLTTETCVRCGGQQAVTPVRIPRVYPFGFLFAIAFALPLVLAIAIDAIWGSRDLFDLMAGTGGRNAIELSLLRALPIALPAFLATGATLLPGSVVGEGAEVRINGVVHSNTTLEPGMVVPIGWVAVGTPASLFSPDRHDEIWAIQQTLDFPGTAYGVSRSTGMDEIMRRQSAFYAAHDDDRVVDVD